MNISVGNSYIILMLVLFWCLINALIVYRLSSQKSEHPHWLSLAGAILAVFVPLNFVLMLALWLKPAPATDL